MSMRGIRGALKRLSFLLALACVAGCHVKECLGLDDGPAGDCFDPDDPCPNDMVTDETGCTWDRCSTGDFNGNLMPCWYTEPGKEEVGYFELAGSRAQYLAYVKKADEHAYMLGQIWLYDMETGEHQPLTEEGRMCYRIKADGDRIGWLEMVEYEKGSAKPPVVDVCVKDIVTGEEWRVPNPDKLKSLMFSLSGDRVVVNERGKEYEWCEVSTTVRRDLWTYDLETRQKTILASAEYGSHIASKGEVHGDRAVYWKVRGYCGEEVINQLWMKDLVTGEEKMIAEMNKAPQAANITSDNDFQFDGKWAVAWIGINMVAYDVETGESKEVTPCNKDCRLQVDQGIVAYDRYGEDGLDQRQVYVQEIATGEKRKLTDLRPYYDSSGPKSFHNGRLMWYERRGYGITKCGVTRMPTGWTSLYFWKDIEF